MVESVSVDRFNELWGKNTRLKWCWNHYNLELGRLSHSIIEGLTAVSILMDLSWFAQWYSIFPVVSSWGHPWSGTSKDLILDVPMLVENYWLKITMSRCFGLLLHGLRKNWLQDWFKALHSCHTRIRKFWKIKGTLCEKHIPPTFGFR